MATTPDNRPWAPHPIPSWLIKEFTRRQKDIGFEYPAANNTVTWTENGTWQNYKGPMTAWARLFSNGTGKISYNSRSARRDGFALYGGQGFDDAFGFYKNSSGNISNQTILGYDSKGEPHTLDLTNDGNLVSFSNKLINDQRTTQKYLPAPGIVSIDSVIQKERIRKVTINWKCYGFAQLEYMTPYFLTPKISMVVEFGWNHFNPESLLFLKDEGDNLEKLKELFLNKGYLLYDDNIKNSFGLYDVTMGYITGFDFSSQDGVTFDCKTEIMSKHANYSGVQVKNAANISSDQNKSIIQSSFPEFLEKRLTKLPNCIEKKKSFRDPLDSEEEKAARGSDATFFFNRFPFYMDTSATPVAKPEDRIFIGRKREYEDSALMQEVKEYDWDAKDQKDVWVTMGFLVELANVFFEREISIKYKDDDKKQKELFSLYNINIDDVKIGAHPNLISTDGNVLLIPNADSPKFNIGFSYPTTFPDDNDYQKQTDAVNPNIFRSNVTNFTVGKIKDLEPKDRTIVKIFKTGKQAKIKKVDDKPVKEKGSNINSTNSTSFFGTPPGSASVFENSFSTNETAGDAVSLFNFGDAKKIYEGIKSYGAELIGTEAGQVISSAKSALPPLSVYRDDLDGILNRFRYRSNKVKKGDFAFPQMTDDTNDTGTKAGHWGYLKDLYINKNVIIEVAKSADTVENFYNNLLNKISTSAANFWDFSVVEEGKHLKIIDKKFINAKEMNIYQFDIGSSNTFIRSINFTAQLSNVAANQVLSSGGSSPSNQENKSPTGEITSNEILNFPYGDRFNPDDPKAKTNRSIDGNLETIKQLQSNPSKGSNSLIMSFTSTQKPDRGRGIAGGINGFNIVNLVLPSQTLLLGLLNDLDYSNNTNVYGGQQPGFTVEMTLQGISGLRTFQLFSLKNLPSPYSEREILCQIIDVSHKVDGGNWTTTIKAGIRSIRGQTLKFTTDGVNSYTINAVN
jgi:hypothetical protein